MALTLKLYQAYNTKNMFVEIDKKPKTHLSKVSFGHHGQMSVILRLIKSYFLYLARKSALILRRAKGSLPAK